MFKRDPEKSAQKAAEREEKQRARAQAADKRHAEKEALKAWRNRHPAEKTMNTAAMMHLWPSSKFGLTSQGPVLGGQAEFVDAGAHKAWTATRLAGGVATGGLSALATGRKNKGAAVINVTFGNGAAQTYSVTPDSTNLRAANQYVNAFNMLAALLAAEEGSAPLPPEVQPQVQSVADELSKLKALLEQGVLTQDEFDKQKTRLLGT
ncbi:SHOCT domain-containing protein [Streptomyces sp. Je 1-369]|uniref:SHOCT domain-containing protein n=1 Tax=Streptomyces sp. Je 1-369 TaxID=2966192 RepID=UPI002285409E|nr:SHOCT domain-containing protein [Streptomyces sp. Je 1-369]WAL99195.1 SHOCT domain-containing protein [Streptomyces sp. Je 1-369]